MLLFPHFIFVKSSALLQVLSNTWWRMPMCYHMRIQADFQQDLWPPGVLEYSNILAMFVNQLYKF